MKRLLIGPAGCGKTHRVLDEFVQHLEQTGPLEQDFFFLLPSAEHTDRILSLILQRGIKGFFFRRVTTFSSLLSEIFSQGSERFASNATRYLILKNIFSGNTWDYFQKVQTTPGFLNLMLSFTAELKESMAGPREFRERMNWLKAKEPELASKYESLAGIYEAYQRGLEERGLLDRPDILRLQRERKLPPPPVRSLKKIWLDGFFDFSNLQTEYLQELSKMASEITITLTYETAARRQSLFASVEHTFKKLRALGFEVEEMKPQPHRFKGKALEHVERYLFSEAKPSVLSCEKEIGIFEAVGIQGEVEMIAREILSVYRKGGYRFSDFAVLLRQIGSYESILRSVFSRFGIPVEIHERERLKLSPMVETLRSLLLIFLEGWKREHLLNFLKSSCVRRLGDELFKNYHWISELENYAYQEGVLAERENWLRPWTGQQSLADSWNQDKQKKLQPLCDLEDELLKANSAGKIAASLRRAIEETFLIFYPEDHFQEPMRRDAASQARLLSLFEEIENQFSSQGKKEISFREFAEHLLRLLEVDLYSLRERNANRVQVYDVSLARQKEYRVVFIAGLLEKTFPAHIKEDPVLSDWERELFNYEMPLSLRLQQPRQQLERYLFYLALTRASERVFLTYPRLDLEGRESLPSFYIQELESLFEKSAFKKKQDLSHPYPSVEEVVHERELEISVMGDLWHLHPRLPADKLFYLTGQMLSQKKRLERFQKASAEIKAEIRQPMILEKDYFKSQRTSPTTLEDYAKCPFKYFARRVLKLQDPQEELNAMIKGKIRHRVLEHFFPLWIKKKNMTSSQIRAQVDQELKDALKEFPLIIEKKYQRELYTEEIRQMLYRFLEEETEYLKATGLQPAHFELSFGRKQDSKALPPIEIQDEERSFKIVGQIDRVDIDPENKTALVLDYKTSDYWDKKQLETGASLQLPVYLLVITKLLGLNPAGAQLKFLNGDKPKGFFNEKYAAAYPGFSKRSMIPDEEFQRLLERSMGFLKQFTREMSQGRIEVMPRDKKSCEKCAYPAVCRIQKWQAPIIAEEIRRTEEERRIKIAGVKS